MLSAADKLAWHDSFAPYIKGKSGQCIYRLKGEQHQPHIEQVGQVMAQLVEQLADNYGSDASYAVLERVFAEHFKLVAETVTTKMGSELSGDNLQSPDDLEATFRRKRGEDHVGYVVNVTETVDEAGGLQLITKVQTEPNVTDDAKMLNDVLPELVERTGLETLYTDGTYGSPAVDETCREQKVTLYQTAIRGASPDLDALTLVDFTFELDAEGNPNTMRCPHGQLVDLQPGHKDDRFIARVSADVCPLCAAHDQRQTQAALCFVLYFALPQLAVALRRQRMRSLLTATGNPRAAVEATVREVTCRFPNSTLRVRGHCRVAMTMVASALMCNALRIWHFNQRKQAKNPTTRLGVTHKSSLFGSFLPFLRRWLRRAAALPSLARAGLPLAWTSVSGLLLVFC